MARTTKADVILRGARERVRTALEDMNLAERKLEIALATLAAYRHTAEQLEKDLAQTSRKVKAPKPAPAAKTRSSPKKEAAASTVSTEGEKGSVSDASSGGGTQSVPCVICGNGATHPDHQSDSSVYHIFRATLKKKNSKDNGEIKLPDNPEDFQHEATA